MKKSRGLAYFTAVNIDGTDEVKIKRSKQILENKLMCSSKK